MSLRSWSCGWLCALMITAFAAAAFGQVRVQGAPQDQYPAPQVQPVFHWGSSDFSGSVRVRGEAWDWFLQDKRTSYAYGDTVLRLDLAQDRSRWGWRLDFEQPTLFGLPSDATLQGAPLGLGAFYYSANHNQRNSAGLFLRQGYVLLRGLAHNGDTVRLGRFEFADGAEGVSSDTSLSWIRSQRIAGRLFGAADWTAAGRSLDGVQFSDDIGGKNNVIFVAGRPTQGVYRTSGWREMDVDILYASYTRDLQTEHSVSEFRFFASGYHDGRRVLKEDNRALALRQADRQNIRIGTFGLDYVIAGTLPRVGRWDFMAWGAIQTGSWGSLKHRANSATAEIGWQPPFPWWRPWLRAGALMGSADGNPNDDLHASFFQMLPSEQQYARIPFYTMQNVEDYTGQAILHPTAKLQLRAEIHKVKLHGSRDLWYQGSGAFENSSFGYTGLGDNGHRGLANFIDISPDYQLTRQLRVGAYLGALSGKAAMTDRLDGRRGGFGYIEMEYVF